MVRQDLRFARLWRLKVPKIERLTHPKPYIVSKLGAFPKPFVCFSLFVQAETLYRAETRCFSETFCLFLPYLLKPKPYIVSKPYTFPKPFACFCLICSSQDPRFSWNSEHLCISVKPRLAFVISETCKPFSSLSAFSLFGATKAVLRV